MRYKIVGIMLTLIVILGASIILLSKSPVVMNRMQAALTQEINNNIHGDVAFRQLTVESLYSVALADVTVRDGEGKLILSASQLNVKLDPWSVLTGDAALTGLKRIELVNPEICVDRRSDGSWNVETLFRDQPGQEEVPFSATVAMTEGTARLTANGTEYIIAKVNGSADFSHNPQIELALQGEYQGRPVSAEGTAKGRDTFLGRIKAAGLDLAFLAPFLPASGQLAIQGGCMEDLTVVLRQQQGQLTYAGEAVIRQAGLDIMGVPVRDGGGRITFTHQSLYLYQVQATVAGQPASAHGRITLNTVEPVLDLYVQSSGLELSSVVPSLPLAGKAAFQLHTVGLASDPAIEGTIAMASGVIAGNQVANLTAPVKLSGGVLTISSASARVFGGNIQADGKISLADQQYQVHLTGSGVELSNVPDLPQDLRGIGAFDIVAQGRGTERPAVNGTMSLSGARWAGLAADQVNAGFSVLGSRTAIDFINILADGGKLSGRGQLIDDEVQLAFWGQSLPLSRFSDLAGTALAGWIDMSGTVSGSLKNPVVAAGFTARDGQVFAQPFTDASGKLTLASEVVSLRQVTVKQGRTTHWLEGDIGLTGDKPLTLTVRTAGARAENLIGLILPGEQLTGNVDNEVAITGTLAAWDLTGKVKLWDGSFRGQLISKIEGRYRRTGGRTQLENFIIQSLNTEVQVKGTVSAANELDLEVKVEDLELAKFSAPGYAMAGQVNFHGRLGGFVSEPSFEGRLTAEKISLNGQEVTGITGQINKTGKNIYVEHFGFNQSGGRFAFTGELEQDSSAIYGIVTVDNGRLGSLLTILNSPVKEIEGPLNGQITIGGTLQRPDIAVKGNLYGGKIKNYPLDTIELDADFTGGVIHVNTFLAKQGSGILAVRGMADLKGEANFQIGGRDIDAGLLTAWLDSTLDASGNLTFSAEINGKTADPQVALSLEIAHGKVGSAEFDSLYGLATMNKGSIFVNQVMLLKGPYKASVYGIVPVAALSKEGRAKGTVVDQMALTMTLDNANLSILPMMTKEVSWAAGETKGKITIGGTLYEPLVEGQILIQDGTIKLKSLGQPLQKVAVDIQFAGDTINIKTFSGSMGGGSYSLTGKAGWKGLDMSDYALDLTLDKLGIDHRFFKGPLQGNMRLAQKNGKALLAGKLLFENTTIDIPLVPELQNSELDLALDLEFVAGKKVRLYNSYLYDILVEGQAKFTGTVARPATAGRFNVLRGTVSYLRTPFTIKEAFVDFTQFRSFIPVIHLEASTRLESTRINLGIHGPMQAMEMKLTAEPSMRQQDIISLLTLRSRYFDKNRSGNSVKDSGLGREELIGLLDAGLQMRFISEMEGALQKAFGLDEFRLVRGPLELDSNSLRRLSDDENFNREAYNIRFGKYITERLMLSYSMGLDSTEYSAGFRYDIRRNFSLTGSFDSDKKYRIGLETRITF